VEAGTYKVLEDAQTLDIVQSGTTVVHLYSSTEAIFISLITSFFTEPTLASSVNLGPDPINDWSFRFDSDGAVTVAFTRR